MQGSHKSQSEEDRKYAAIPKSKRQKYMYRIQIKAHGVLIMDKVRALDKLNLKEKAHKAYNDTNLLNNSTSIGSQTPNLVSGMPMHITKFSFAEIIIQ